MKIDKQFQLILAVAFFIPLIRQIASAVRFAPVTYVFLRALIYNLTMVIIPLIPILLFALFYYIGKKPYLTFEMRPILLALLIGSIASSLVGSIIYLTIRVMTHVSYIPPSLGDILGYIFQSMLTYVVVDPFVALAGLSIGYMRQKKLVLIAEPESS